ncbi:hypothetical protein PoB_001341500 [Plakobranchus ocellatus]|uniref:Uncharacterized protein n=1 Tax=Plakobranchus ocellatus TaxID=259542 RepID=A0AAV3YVM0_9GAST|nr:hypothetical protein PoB_001341500 [Plakobranchus ocellatus]
MLDSVKAVASITKTCSCVTHPKPHITFSRFQRSPSPLSLRSSSTLGSTSWSLFVAAAACLPVFRAISEFLMSRGGLTMRKKQGEPRAATAPPQACILSEPQQPTANEPAVTSALQSYSHNHKCSIGPRCTSP